MRSQIIRAIVAGLFALVGLGWVSMLNGQVYSNSVGCLACLFASAGLCVWGYREVDGASRLRYLWVGATAVLGLVCVIVAVQLPGAYRYQQNFNTNLQATFEKVGSDLSNRPK